MANEFKLKLIENAEDFLLEAVRYAKASTPRSLSDSKMKSSINSDRIFYKTAAMARFVSIDS